VPDDGFVDQVVTVDRLEPTEHLADRHRAIDPAINPSIDPSGCRGHDACGDEAIGVGPRVRMVRLRVSGLTVTTGTKRSREGVVVDARGVGGVPPVSLSHVVQSAVPV